MNSTSSSELQIHARRCFSVSADRVFDAWLNATMLSRWMFGPAVRDERIVHLQLDPRVDGRFSFRAERAGTEIEHGGRYVAIERPHRLAFTWGAWAADDHGDDSSLVEIVIVDNADGCTLVLTHSMSQQWAEYATRTEQGWNRMLETLDKALANDAHGVVISNDSVRFERLLPGPIERVWDHLVDPEKRRRWLAGGPMGSVVGADVALQFRNAELSRDDDRAPERYREQENDGRVFGRIRICEPPHRLVFSWHGDPSTADEDASEVDIALRASGDQVLLTLTHRRLCMQVMSSVGAGWHTHLGILEDVLAQREPRRFWRTHTALEPEYAARLD
ncbi:MAG: hypothetical protein HOP03_02990 [Lysobacter sp.]|nr:hypothetical protein [Lysobacter sp.]